jgi:hypothetical protein
MVGWMRVCWLTGEMVDRRGRRDAAHRQNTWVCIITGSDLSSNVDQHRGQDSIDQQPSPQQPS